jgi:DNA transformation protein and related proteins
MAATSFCPKWYRLCVTMARSTGPAARKVAKKAVAKKAVAKRTVAKRTVAKRSASKRTAGKNASNVSKAAGGKTAARTGTRTATGAGTRTGTGAFAHMKVSASFREYVLAQLDELGDVTARAMFGGVGLYRDGVFFGIIAGDVLYLRVGEANRRDFDAHHAQPFRPYPDRPSTKYFAVPVEILESARELAVWARKSLRAAAQSSAR